MTAYYNWVAVTGDTGEDVYIVSKIHFEAEGFISYLLSIWDEYSLSIGVPCWSRAVPFPPGHPVERTFTYPFGTYRDQTYSFDDGYFEGMAVGPDDIMRLWAFNIEEVDYPATRAEIQTASLAELVATDYMRSKLLNRGKYLKGERDSYRVLLPSENAGQVLAYMKAADGKLKRGLKLNRNTPVQYKVNSQDEVRIMMKSDDIKDKIK